jgi:hypothetical protein
MIIARFAIGHLAAGQLRGLICIKSNHGSA